jgi:hypothetical protein
LPSVHLPDLVCEGGEPVSVLRSRGPSHSAAPAWLFDLLFAKTPAVTWAPSGALPDGFDRAERFAVLPGGGGRSFMVSLAAPRGASSALTSYNALRPARKRLARSVLGAGLRAGLVQPLLRDKIDIGIVHGSTADDLAGGLLSEYLQKVFAKGPVVLAFGSGAGPYRKPVLQVFSTRGIPLGYVKVGWNDWTREAVRHEAAALRTCAAGRPWVGVPELLGMETWRGLDLLVTAPLPRGIRRVGNSARLPAELVRDISKLAGVETGKLGPSPWWAGIRSRLGADLGDPPARVALAAAAERIENAHGDVTLQFGSWHGDLVPWNLARLGRRLYAWDWESSTPDAPVGFDALHYYFQVEFVARGRPLEEAAARAARDARPVLEALGVPLVKHGLLATLHLLELSLRHQEAYSSSGDTDERFYPSILGLLGRAPALPTGPLDPGTARRAA